MSKFFHYVLAVILFGATAVRAQTRIEWQVDNPYRLFGTSSGEVTDGSSALDAISQQSSVSSAYIKLEHYLRADSKPRDRAVYLHNHFMRDYGVYEPTYLKPSDEVIVAHLADPSLDDVTCVWSESDIPLATQACSKPIRITLAFDQNTFHAKGIVKVETSNSVNPAARSSYTVSIDAPDLLVLGLGDSYASGEGNPDRPADLSQVKVPGRVYARPTDWWRPFPATIQNGGVLPQRASADWWSNECHRSLFSPHALAAMRLAVASQHQSVTFLSFACSGASVLDGFVSPQESPPGEARASTLKGAILASKYSQIDQAIFALCAYATTQTQSLDYDAAKYPVWDGIYTGLAHRTAPPTYQKCSKWTRQPDLIFVTIGGNDVGFAGLGAWALVPYDLGIFTPLINNTIFAQEADSISWNHIGFMCPDQPFKYVDPVDNTERTDPRCNGGGAGDKGGARHLIQDELPNLLKLADAGLRESHLADRAVIIQETYPGPFYDQRGLLCGSYPNGLDFKQVHDLEEPWRALDVMTVFPPLSLRVDRIKAANLAVIIVPSLDHVLTQVSEADGWTVVQPPPDYSKHGFCAGEGGLNSDFGFPRPKISFLFLVSPSWDSSFPAPAEWDPYRPERKRWLRDANDSVLTEMVSDIHGAVTTESIVGMLHPSAAGEAAVADGLFAAIPKRLFVAAPGN